MRQLFNERHEQIPPRTELIGQGQVKVAQFTANRPEISVPDETGLEAEARLLRLRLDLIISSPGWKAICTYRRLVRRFTANSRILRRGHDRLLGLLFSLLLGTGKSVTRFRS